ncbi:unnamed protein product [Clonostachys chloroleuca]|uniref:Nephrocystin 3-like N-terminal domain-containing protein n=1 Tax=Clonostachys chloroleuca TaxID=1926264 RepID=A0AA35LZN8_9HYPO|nr:unnamed protein product [Clonostachys chloroleuca]
MSEGAARSNVSTQDQRGFHALRDPTQQNVGSADTIHRVYRFAWICALYFEMTAARAMLDEFHEPLAFQPPEDPNNYLLGSICQHNVVIACLPNGQYGTNDAANVVANLQRTFPSIEFGLMVGVGGGIPDNEDIRLGDIVVGTKIVQHDLGKTLGEGKVHRTGQPVLPSRALNTTISTLRAKHELEPSRISFILKERMGKYSDYCRPKAPDRLFQREYQHVPGTASDVLDRDSMVKILKYPEMNSRQDIIETAEEHTCRWFLANSHYRAWLDPRQLKISHGFLWITGKPGAGKSVMMKFLSAEMREQGQQTHGVIISFFFDTRGSILQKSVTGMYRSLLHQLFGAYWDLPSILDRPEFRAKTEDTHLAVDNLKALLKAAVLKLNTRRLTCFIDALDECDEQQALEMIYFLEELTKISTKNDIPLRICLSSRPYPHMLIPISILLTLEDQPGHTTDMESYISNNLRIEDPNLAEELKLKIIQKASGVFMWVVVVIPILNDYDRWGRPTIKRQLEELPDTLTIIFKDILTRDKNNPDDLLFSVLWVLYAKWPLTPEEYYHALWSGLHLRGHADAEIPDLSDTFVQRKINRYVVTSSKGLVEVTKSSVPTVQFIHETFKVSEYSKSRANTPQR